VSLILEDRFYFAFFDEGSLGSRLGNLILGIADVSVLHDFFQIVWEMGLQGVYSMFQECFLVAGITYTGCIDIAPTSVAMGQMSR